MAEKEEPILDIGTEIREALIRASLVSEAREREQGPFAPCNLYRNQALAAIASRLPPRKALRAARGIEDSTVGGYSERGDALVEITVRMPAQEALGVAREIESRASQSIALGDIASRLSEPQRSEVFQEAIAIACREEDALFRGCALAEIAAKQPESQRESTQSLAIEAAHESDRRDFVLRKVAASGSPRVALKLARQIEAPLCRSETLTEIALRMSEDERQPFLREALEVALDIDDGYCRGEALADIAWKMRPATALKAGKRIEDRYNRSRVLAEATSKLPPEEALEIVPAIDDPHYNSSVLKELAERLPPDEAVQTARRIEIGVFRGMALTEAASRLPTSQREAVFEEALEVIRGIEGTYPLNRDYTRTCLSAETASMMEEPRRREILFEALDIARGISERGYDSNSLQAVALRMDPEEGLHVAREMPNKMWCSETLVDIAKKVPEPRKRQILAEAFELATTSSASLDDDAIAELTTHLVAYPREFLYPLWTNFLSASSERERNSLLDVLAHLVPMIEYLGGTRALEQMSDAIHEVARRWP